VPDVRVDNTVLPRWLTDPHIDNLTCLDIDVKENWCASNIAYLVCKGSAVKVSGADCELY